MPKTEEQNPWDHLEALVEDAPRREIESFLATLSAGEIARAVSRLSHDDQDRLLTRLRPDDAADLIETLPDPQAAEIVERLEPTAAARIVHELPSDERADLIGDLPEPEAKAILEALPPAEADQVRTMAEYPADTAGGLMVTEYLSFLEDRTVADVVSDLRRGADRYADYDVQYAYVTNRSGCLVGVLRLRDLLLAPELQGICNLMILAPVTVSDTSDLDELRAFFEQHNFLGVPVVDSGGRLLGVIHRASVEEALSERSDQDYLKTQGIVGGEELRGMPLLLRSRRRLAWLSVNVLLNIVAASVIALYQDTLQAVIALAVFLPIISDMSGCSGNQAVAVSMRELTLGLIQARDVVRVWLKEVFVGVINGVALGLLIAAAASLWQANAWLGLVVGGALAANTVVAVSIGGTVPLMLRRFGIDPALASGPVLTTITDMCGFFLTLSLAAALLPRLVG